MRMFNVCENRRVQIKCISNKTNHGFPPPPQEIISYFDIENTSTVFLAAKMFTESLPSKDDIPLLL
jgi:hypothetical protein